MDWRWRPEVTLPLALAVVAYASGWARLAHRSPAGHRPALVRRLVLSLAGLVVLAVALLGLHDAAHERFLPHMIQHLLLMMVAIPLLLLADPLPAVLWALPAAARRRVGAWLTERAPARRAWRALTRLPVAWTLYALVLWLWHLPVAYDAALAHGWLHDLEHGSFASSGRLACSTAWTSTSRPARRSPCSAPTAPAKRRCSRSSPRCSGPRAAPRRWPATTARGSPRPCGR